MLYRGRVFGQLSSNVGTKRAQIRGWGRLASWHSSTIGLLSAGQGFLMAACRVVSTPTGWRIPTDAVNRRDSSKLISAGLADWRPGESWRGPRNDVQFGLSVGQGAGLALFPVLIVALVWTPRLRDAAR